jgi:formylglycine-generating enzyme required for sulfatase activity
MKSYITILVAVLFLSSFGLPCLAACPSADLTGDCFVDFDDFAIMAGQWLADYDSDDLAAMALEWLTGGTSEPDMTWVSINDPGVSGHEGFSGQMSKYETTNAQYCLFLNTALASGDITIGSDNKVYGANGSNSGTDFIDQVYYDLAGPGSTQSGATDGGAARINYSGGVFTVDSGFENHPVTWVSWYGSTAFCNYYGYRLPTEWEWQAVADYDGSYLYGCGTTINNNIANYDGSTHPNGTTMVGAFGAYGYGMCDMAGNVTEWTSSTMYSIFPVFRDGSWGDLEHFCSFASWGINYPYEMNFGFGFRVCR